MLTYYNQKTADRGARAAGSIYRVVAGTESLDTALQTIKTDTLNANGGNQTDDQERTAKRAATGPSTLVNTDTKPF